MNRGNFNFQEKYEDIHLNIEKKLFDIIENVAGYVHTARSRNDQVVTDFKMWTTSANAGTDAAKSLVKKAEKNIDTVISSYKPPKNAQPVSFAHYLLAYYEMLKRDKQRFKGF